MNAYQYVLVFVLFGIFVSNHELHIGESHQHRFPAQRRCGIFSCENWGKPSLLLVYGYCFIIFATSLYWGCWLFPFLLLTKTSFGHSAFDITFIKVHKSLFSGAFVFPGLAWLTWSPFFAKFLAVWTTWIFLKPNLTFYIKCHPCCVNTIHNNETVSLCTTL